MKPNGTAIRIPVSRANVSTLLIQPQLSDEDVFTAKLIWTDNPNKIGADSNIKSISTSRVGSGGFLVVEPGSAGGNAIVAIMNSSS